MSESALGKIPQYPLVGGSPWKYDPDVFNTADTDKDGFLNYEEAKVYRSNMIKPPYLGTEYETTKDFIDHADINKDGLISKGEIAIYKVGEYSMTEDAFKTRVYTDTEKKQKEWENFHDEYNNDEHKGIITQDEIKKHDNEVHRKALPLDSLIYSTVDENVDGFLNKDELKHYLQSIQTSVNEKYVDYMFEKLDINKDNRVSVGEFALYKVNSDNKITYDNLVNAGFSKADAEAMVQKYAPEGQSSFTKDDVEIKDNPSYIKQDNNGEQNNNEESPNSGTKDTVARRKEGLTAGGFLALFSFFLVMIGIIAWGIWWIGKDDKKEKDNDKHTETTTTTITEIREIGNDAENNLKTINSKGENVVIS